MINFHLIFHCQLCSGMWKSGLLDCFYSTFVCCLLSKIYFIANFAQVININLASILKCRLIYLALFKPLDSLEIGPGRTQDTLRQVSEPKLVLRLKVRAYET